MSNTLFASGAGQGPTDPGKTQVIGGAKANPTFAYLIVRTGMRAGHVFQLRPDVTTIGREAENHIFLDDPAVSRNHLKVRAEAGESAAPVFMLYDLATENGTKVNGEPIMRHPLTDGDEISVGQTTLVFKQI